MCINVKFNRFRPIDMFQCEFWFVCYSFAFFSSSYAKRRKRRRRKRYSTHTHSKKHTKLKNKIAILQKFMHLPLFDFAWLWSDQQRRNVFRRFFCLLKFMCVHNNVADFFLSSTSDMRLCVFLHQLLFTMYINERKIMRTHLWILQSIKNDNFKTILKNISLFHF